MNTFDQERGRVIAWASLFTIVWALLLFGADFGFSLLEGQVLDEEGGDVKVYLSPSQLIPFEEAHRLDPNQWPSRSTSVLNLDFSLGTTILGRQDDDLILRDSLTRQELDAPEHYSWSTIYGPSKKWMRVSYDQVTQRFHIEHHRPNGPQGSFGPKGGSYQSDPNQGRFIKPLAALYRSDHPQFFVYDQGTHIFYRYDISDTITVRKAPPLPAEIKIISVGSPNKNEDLVWHRWTPPLRLETETEQAARIQEERDRALERQEATTIEELSEHAQHQLEVTKSKLCVPIHEYFYQGNSPLALLALDDQGNIYRVDPVSLTLSDPVGRLPQIRSAGPNPDHYLAYRADAILERDQYLGCIVSAVPRRATEVIFSVFDQHGGLLATRRASLPPGIRTHSSLSNVGRAVVEQLQPPITSLLTLAVGSRIEALAGYRGLFIRPNAIIQHVAHASEHPAENRVLVLVWMVPSLVLGAWLGWFISKDAARLGLSAQTRKRWFVAALLMGIVAYLTYRMTRPQVSQVTCKNCGQARRTDWEHCQHCEAKWQVPELTAPAWRVVDLA